MVLVILLLLWRYATLHSTYLVWILISSNNCVHICIFRQRQLPPQQLISFTITFLRRHVWAMYSSYSISLIMLLSSWSTISIRSGSFFIFGIYMFGCTKVQSYSQEKTKIKSHRSKYQICGLNVINSHYIITSLLLHIRAKWDEQKIVLFSLSSFSSSSIFSLPSKIPQTFK